MDITISEKKSEKKEFLFKLLLGVIMGICCLFVFRNSSFAAVTLQQGISSQATSDVTFVGQTFTESIPIDIFYVDVKITPTTSSFFTGTAGANYGVDLYADSGVVSVASFRRLGYTSDGFIRFELCAAPGSCGTASTTNFRAYTGETWGLFLNGILDTFKSYGSTNAGSYANGCLSVNPLTFACTTSNSVQDLFFRFSDIGSNPLLGNGINFVFPTNGSSTDDFLYWAVNYSIATSLH